MTQQEILKLIKEYLHLRYQMVLATNGEHPWVATLYYSLDSNLNLYFLTNPETIHAQHIAVNPQVAVAVADSPQLPNSDKVGVQIYGVASQISSRHKITHALGLWCKTLGVTNSEYTYEGMKKKLIDGQMYLIVPKKIKFFNEAIWEEGKEPVIEL